MTMAKKPDKGSNKNVGIIDFGKDIKRRDGDKKGSPEDFCQSELDSSIHPKSQGPLPNSSLESGDLNRRPNTRLALDFWSQGVAKCKALELRSNKNDKACDSTALIKEPAKSHTERDTAESAPSHSSDQSYQSMILPLSTSENTSALSSGIENRAWQVPDSSGTVPNKIALKKDKPLDLPQWEICEDQAPKIKGCEKSSGFGVKNCHSPGSASLLDTPTKSCGGSPHDSQKPKPVTSADLTFGNETPSRLSETPRLSHPEEQQLNTSLPLKLPPVAENRQMPRTKGISQVSNSRSSIPSTPTKSPKSGHLRAFSAEAAAFRPSPRSISWNEIFNSYHGERKASTSTETGHFSPGYVPAVPKTPLQQRLLGHSMKASIGTPYVPFESAFSRNTGSSRHTIAHPHYPKPHQHTPEEEGQVFGTQGSVPLQMRNHTPYPYGPIMPPPFPSFIRSFDNTVHQNAQIYEQGEQNPEYSQPNHFDSYTTSQAANAAPNVADLHQNGNMYTQDTNGYGARYFSNHTDPARQVHRYPLYIDRARLKENQLNQNLYSPLEPHREPSKSNHRTGRDMFIPEDIRLKLHTRTEATLRVFAGRRVRFKIYFLAVD